MSQRPAPLAPEAINPARKRRRLLSVSNSDRLLALGTPIALLLLWEASAHVGLVDARFFPAPSSIFATMGTLISSGELWTHVWVSLQRLFWGFWLGLIPAIFLGVVMGLNRPIRSAISPLISGTYPIPKSALLPLILLIFGLGEASKIVMVAIGVFYPVVINTMSGVIQVAPIYYDVAKNYGASRRQVFKSVAIPGAMPSIMTGIELGAGLGLILIAIAEMMGAQDGLGFMIWNAWQLFSVETMYVGIFVIAIIGYIVSLFLAWVAKRVMPWKR